MVLLLRSQLPPDSNETGLLNCATVETPQTPLEDRVAKVRCLTASCYRSACWLGSLASLSLGRSHG
jgi:hypothetical protein